jgi:hypothetical protein
MESIVEDYWRKFDLFVTRIESIYDYLVNFYSK